MKIRRVKFYFDHDRKIEIVMPKSSFTAFTLRVPKKFIKIRKDIKETDFIEHLLMKLLKHGYISLSELSEILDIGSNIPYKMKILDYL